MLYKTKPFGTHLLVDFKAKNVSLKFKLEAFMMKPHDILNIHLIDFIVTKSFIK